MMEKIKIRLNDAGESLFGSYIFDLIVVMVVELLFAISCRNVYDAGSIKTWGTLGILFCVFLWWLLIDYIASTIHREVDRLEQYIDIAMNHERTLDEILKEGDNHIPKV